MTATTRAAAQGLMSTRTVAGLLGISYRMLDYWCRVSTSGVLQPTVGAEGSGSSRGYTRADVMRLQKAVVLCKALGSLTGSGTGGAPGIRVETLEAFVLGAEPYKGGWRWVTPEFDLRL